MEIDPKLKSAVEKLKSGDAEGFNEVYSKTYNYVYFRAKQIMKNEDDAMDLMQIVYMEAYKSISGLETPESIYSWLSSITFRQGMKIFQKKKEILLDEDFENIFDSIETSDKDSRPELSYEKKEEQRLLADLIDSLPEVQRATVVAFYYDNIKIEEIAEVMDCSVGTVKSRLSYARQALKKKLEASGKGRAGKGAMALTGAMIFGAVQLMSEETVLAAPIAAGAFANICSGLGIAGGAVMAGSALVGGAGISAATGSTAGTAAALAGGTAAAGTAAGSAAAAGTAAGSATAGTAAGSAAAGTAAGSAAAAGTAAVTGGAAKGIAVAVAVAVAGTGGTVGTIYRNTVSSVDKISANEEAYSTASDDILVPSDAVSSVEDPLEEAVIPSEAPAEIPDAGVPLEEENTSSESAEAENGKSESEHEKKEKTAVSENGTEDVNEFGMPKKVKQHIAKAVASLFMTGGGVLYNGSVDNDTLEAAYILENNLFKTKKELKSVSGNLIFLTEPDVSRAYRDGDVITVEGSFKAGNAEENGTVNSKEYAFTLKGTRLKNEGVFGRFASNMLIITDGSNDNGSPSSNESGKKTSKDNTENKEKEKENNSPETSSEMPGVIELPTSSHAVEEVDIEGAAIDEAAASDGLLQ
ncbi:MAG: RNA polymerase sigma factor [Lachnospiraceae bacterium]|nr:RNA polymerase sigma factor [Lachnospiraceae bacterium]